MIYDYRQTLRKELEERVLRNSSYSLRSMARDLEIPAPRLSEILNHRRGTTLAKGEVMCRNLSLSKKETQLFLLSIEALHARSPKNKEAARLNLFTLSQDHNINFLDDEKFSIISSWYHFEILE